MNETRVPGFFQRFAGQLRFPQLLLLSLVLFLADLLVPDFIPLVDEILLGLITLMLGMWKQKKGDPTPATEEVKAEDIGQGKVQSGKYLEP